MIGRPRIDVGGAVGVGDMIIDIGRLIVGVISASAPVVEVAKTVCTIGLGIGVVKNIDEGVDVTIGVVISGSQFFSIGEKIMINTAPSNKQIHKISILGFNRIRDLIVDLPFSITCVKFSSYRSVFPTS